MAMMESLPVGTILMYDGSGWQDNVTLKGWYACVSANAGHHGRQVDRYSWDHRVDGDRRAAVAGRNPAGGIYGME